MLINKEDDQPLGLRNLPQAQLYDLAKLRTEMPNHNNQVPDQEKELASEVSRLVRDKQWDLSKALQHCEKVLVREALEMTKGNQGRAAQLLGVTPRSVYNLIRRHQLLVQ
jgi:transcriptional regulator with GAF, ATPase, and Fis domain